MSFFSIIYFPLFSREKFHKSFYLTKPLLHRRGFNRNCSLLFH